MMPNLDADTHCPLCKNSGHVFLYPIDMGYAEKIYGSSIPEIFTVVRCSTCKHQYISPIPSPDFLRKFYANYMSEGKNGFYLARNSADIPVSFRSYYAPWLMRIQEIIRKPSSALLDIGCGLGMFLRLARELGFEVRGIEPNKEAVAQLETTYSIHAYNTLLEDYSGQETFDVVTMWDLLEHLPSPQKAINKVWSMLNPAGLIVLDIPIRDSLLHWVAKFLYRSSLGIIKRPLFLICGAHHLQYFSENSIVSFVEKSGFQVLLTNRAETNLDALQKKGICLKNSLFNVSLRSLFGLARLIRKQNKLVLIARKLTSP